MDICKKCGEALYPSDETVSVDFEEYHIECAEECGVDNIE